MTDRELERLFQSLSRTVLSKRAVDLPERAVDAPDAGRHAKSLPPVDAAPPAGRSVVSTPKGTFEA